MAGDYRSAGFHRPIYLAGLQYHFDLTRFLVGDVGVMLAVMGNSMGKLRPNSFAGFRTPWCHKSRTVWIKIRRLGGRLMVGYGLGMLVESLFLKPLFCFLAGALPMIILVALVPATFSYFSFQAEKKASTTSPH